MQHDWLRTVAGFKTPHRISTLKSYIDYESTQLNESGQVSTLFVMGQNTGVDGDFMKPEGKYTTIDSDAVFSIPGKLQFSWTDDGSQGDYPEAKSIIHKNITIPLDDYTALPADQFTVAFNGFSIKSICDDEKQPIGISCNSNGMWPYKFHLSLTPGEIIGNDYQFTVCIEISRAWTTNKGGIIGVEEKPFDGRLDIDLDIYYVVLGGRNSQVAVSDIFTIAVDGQLKNDDPYKGKTQIQGKMGFEHATTLISSIGFELKQSKVADKYKRLGRYIGKIQYSITDGAYDPLSGLMDYGYTMHVWAPDTVTASDITYVLSTQLLQFQTQENFSLSKTATGSVCCNSTDNAPFFSRWQKCGTQNKGPEQDEDLVVIPN
ncbi:MAG: hypothetical protein GY710_14320 [Desulfobacteraceae bacterium]|nr:hypothetical protein [Desulfobacteraceae bacterium]